MNNRVKKIKVIEAINPFVVSFDNPEARKLRVCAYARVSTDEEDQANSFENQIEAYQTLINNNEAWEFSGMYADRGITGTQMKRREQFMQMISDAKNGKIDLILTKSISRFGRNTVEVLQTVRELRELGVEIFFEKENLNSSDTKLDFVLTIMSSVAQEESRSISENIRWSVTKRFKEGKIILNTKNFLGYTKDEKGNLVIIPEEAKIIETIFDLYLKGHSAYDISKILMKEKIKTATGKDKWQTSAVLRILQNEKYAGDAILQKTYTVDYLTHKSVPNDNIVDKYYVENSHPGIISKEDFNMVQEMIKKETEDTINTPKNSKYPLTNLVYCSTCKRPMKRHVHNHNRKSEKIVLNCNHAPKNPNIKCVEKPIDNELIMSVLNDVISGFISKDRAHAKVIKTLKENPNRAELSAKLKELTKDNEYIMTELDSFVNENLALAKEDPKSFNMTYSKYKDKIEKNNLDISRINLEISNSIISESRKEIINNFIKNNSSIAEGILIRAVFKLIIVTPTNDLVIILNDNKYSPSEIINDFTILNDTECLIDKTLYDKDLNKNISYKVVQLNDQ
ncbi:recombinase family protein [Acholeplasma laidlawii]|uniref:recombinase family protein n=1 Tax=Acholeplasma laidlawii TaxID=2148 RepID=UPI0018C1F9B6|nr:recombinase family protein [Acholeplasma laidlawii]MBG0763099.1 recombinase family protein [Acholeplasma laidlawii]